MKNKEVAMTDKTVGYSSDGYHAGTATVRVRFEKDRATETVTLEHAGHKISVPFYAVERLAKQVRERYNKANDEPLPGQVELEVE